MDIVLVGLPGSGKSVVGRRLAHRHAASFIDLDERDRVERRPVDPGDLRGGRRGRLPGAWSGRRSPTSARPTAAPDVRRVIATGGGAVVDPRNRWALYRGRTAVWLDGRPEVLAQRLRRSPHVRPLVTGRDPIGTIRDLAARRERFYAAAAHPSAGVGEVHGVVDAVEAQARVARTPPTRDDAPARRRRRSAGSSLGEGIAGRAPGRASSTRSRARRAILVSEPGAWAAVGESLADGAPRARPATVERVMLPEGEAAKRLAVIEDGGQRAGAAPGRARRAARRDRWRRPRRRGRVPGRDLPARRAA